MSLVEIHNVEKEYLLGEIVINALQNVTLIIDRGRFMAVWGPSGSGKTTLLNLIGAIDLPTRGRVLINGQDIAAISDNKRTELRNKTIGYVFQKFNLIPVLSALENVALPLQLQGVAESRAQERAMDRLEEVGLAGFVQHRPDKLSGGQQQRVAIARALVTEPSLVIADEPTANLDSESSLHIIELMRNLNQQKKTTFIFSTHDQRLLKRVDQLIRLEDGRIVNGGSNG